MERGTDNSVSTLIYLELGVCEGSHIVGNWGVLSPPEEEGGGDVQKLPALVCVGAGLEDAFGHTGL